MKKQKCNKIWDFFCSQIIRLKRVHCEKSTNDNDQTGGLEMIGCIYASIYYLYENDYKTYFIIKIVSLILPLKSERKSMWNKPAIMYMVHIYLNV